MGSPPPLAYTFQSPVILFDGVCNLCNGAINFVIERDKKKKFRFASLQSDVGKSYLTHFNFRNDIYSIILIKDGKALEKSSAALEIAKGLSGIWPWLSIFKILPRSFRDAVYDFIAKRRYRWFGRRDACRVPTPELRARFLES